MAEPGLPKPENFFDDGDDNILARLEPGEKPEDYGLVEVGRYHGLIITMYLSSRTSVS